VQIIERMFFITKNVQKYVNWAVTIFELYFALVHTLYHTQTTMHKRRHSGLLANGTATVDAVEKGMTSSKLQ
jgi:hypothetical protein